MFTKYYKVINYLMEMLVSMGIIACGSYVVENGHGIMEDIGTLMIFGGIVLAACMIHSLFENRRRKVRVVVRKIK